MIETPITIFLPAITDPPELAGRPAVPRGCDQIADLRIRLRVNRTAVGRGGPA